MTEGQSCHIGNPLLLTLCLAFFVTLIFNVYINDTQSTVIHQKLPEIAKQRSDPSQELETLSKNNQLLSDQVSTLQKSLEIKDDALTKNNNRLSSEVSELRKSLEIKDENMEAKDSLINTLKAEVEADQVVIEQIKESNSKPGKPSETTTTIEPPRNCKPLQKLAFAKTHKTGGSTLQNIFMRYGWARGLTFAIPVKNWMYSFNEFFTAKQVTNYTWNPQRTFDMMVFHSLWNGPEVDKVIPKPSKRVTLLRDPVDTFESGYVYMGLENSFKMNINEYAKKIVRDGFPARKPKSWFDKNELLWDLGMQVGKMEGKSDLRDRIMFYENEFDLVLLAERFDESLVVMKDVLCWDTQDIKYLKQNERAAEFKANAVTPETRLILQQWMWSDYQLYNYFNHKLSDQIAEIGAKKVRNDLRALRKENDILHDRCNAHFVDNNSLKGTPMHMAHHMVKAYGISENCTYYAIAEPAFYGKIKQQQKAGRPKPQKIND